VLQQKDFSSCISLLIKNASPYREAFFISSILKIQETLK
jgi:hypothetical protein